MMPDLIEKPWRAVQAELFLPAEEDAHKVIKPDEMVHVGMGDKDVRYPQNLARRQVRDFPQIEEEGPPLIEKIDENRGIAKRAVNEGRVKLWLHVFVPLDGANSSSVSPQPEKSCAGMRDSYVVQP
jgi:hypothetical protein